MAISRIETNSIAPSQTLTTPIIATTMGVGGATPSGSGSGITFPATQSASTDANTLDDYEEGTFTPNLNNATYTFSSQLGTYTKVGRLVTAYVFIQISAISNQTANACEITGLPFTTLNSNSIYGGQSINVDALNANHTQVGVQVVPNATMATLIANIGTTGGHVGLQTGWLTSSSVVRAVLTYQAA